jgi:thiol-disulfide isomerase/thioredoxin
VSAWDIILRKWPEKSATPALKLTSTDGREWDLQQLRGKVVVLNYWASWCGPCVDELPLLNRLAEKNPDKLAVLGVNYKESRSAIERFSAAHPIRYPILMDKTGEHFKTWSNGVMPTTVLIDRNGRARWRIVGELDESDPRFRQALDKLLTE